MRWHCPAAALYLHHCRQAFSHAGGIAHFTEIAFGPLGSLMASFVFLGAVAFGLPAIALTGGYCLAEIMPGQPVFHAMLILVSATLFHLFSVKAVGRISTFIASGILVALLGLVGIGLYVLDWGHINTNTSTLAEWDTRRIFAPFMMIFFAFTGWEVAAGTSGELKNPERDFPRAMILSYFAAVAIYLAMAFVVQNTAITGAHEAAFTSIVGAVFGETGRVAVAMLATAIIFANLMGAIWAVSRMVLSLSRKNYLPIKLEIRENGSPVSAVLITSLVLFGVLSMDGLGVLSISRMLAIAGQNFLILYGVTGLTLLKLSAGFGEKLLALVTIGIVFILLLVQGTSLFYPLCLIIAAWFAWHFSDGKKRK